MDDDDRDDAPPAAPGAGAGGGEGPRPDALMHLLRMFMRPPRRPTGDTNDAVRRRVREAGGRAGAARG
jgi:hypothetical protein